MKLLILPAALLYAVNSSVLGQTQRHLQQNNQVDQFDESGDFDEDDLSVYNQIDKFDEDDVEDFEEEEPQMQEQQQLQEEGPYDYLLDDLDPEDEQAPQMLFENLFSSLSGGKGGSGEGKGTKTQGGSDILGGLGGLSNLGGLGGGLSGITSLFSGLFGGNGGDGGLLGGLGGLTSMFSPGKLGTVMQMGKKLFGGMFGSILGGK